jgi:isopenicillin N synthase-like dioxygenase
MGLLRSMILSLGLIIAAEANDVFTLDIISYEDFVNEDPVALQTLQTALSEKGIAGISGIPGYREKVAQYIDMAKEFSALPEEVKENYAPNRDQGATFLGYERGKEKFQRPDGSWFIDDLKVSYYGFIPEVPENRWPTEIDVQTPFQDLGALMSEMGTAVMEKIGLIGPKTGISLDGIPRLGRMLYYRKSVESSIDNPYWCGAHFDHSLFTTLIPGHYFVDGIEVEEPEEAGLYVKIDGVYKKVVMDDRDVLMFQVGEFGQLVSNDAIRATEHRVHKAYGSVERYAMALFCDAPMDLVIRSTSVLTQDSRYGGGPGEPCSYHRWNEETFKRFIVKEEDDQ